MAHGVPTRVLVQVYGETGRKAEADRVARDYLVRRVAWDTPDVMLTVTLLGILRSDGVLSKSDWEREVEAALPGVSHPIRAHRWAAAYGHVSTQAEAIAALELLPPGELVFRDRLDFYATLAGHVFLLAGRVDEAIALLRPEAKRCMGLVFPFEYMHAHLWLGEALEAKGDKEGACAAYRFVRDRWGHAKPRSVSAEEAKRRSTALACPD